MPTFLKGSAPADGKDRQKMADELLQRSRILAVCVDQVNDESRAILLYASIA